jgi:hypothetical protein
MIIRAKKYYLKSVVIYQTLQLIGQIIINN